MAKILITGRNSFIGSAFISLSSNRDVKSVSVRNYTSGAVDFSGIDIVIHFAALVHQFKKKDESEYYAVNTSLSLALARDAKAAGVSHFIFVSTVKVYGKWKDDIEPWSEHSDCHPVDPYGKSKLAAEQELAALESPGFCITILRTPIVYGPGVSANILKLIKLTDRIPVLPFGRIANNRHYTFIDNLVSYIDRIIELKASGIFIAMDSTALSTTDLVRLISSKLNKRRLLIRLPSWIIITGVKLYPALFERLYCSFRLNNSETNRILNFEPPFSTEYGIEKTIAGYCSGRQNEKEE